MIRVDIYHNVLWSKYKAGVFSAIFNQPAVKHGDILVDIIQIAATERQRKGMGDSWEDHHKYKYNLLFPCPYEDIPWFSKVVKLFLHAFNSNCDIAALPGYYRVEHWAMLVGCLLSRKKIVVFCDSTLFDNSKRFTANLLKRVFLHFCDGAFTYGSRGVEHLAYFGVSPSKIVIRRQCAALLPDYQADVLKLDRMRFTATRDSPRFLYVGRLSSEKGLLTLIDAF